jgi:hypothetical protein
MGFSKALAAEPRQSDPLRKGSCIMVKSFAVAVVLMIGMNGVAFAANNQTDTIPFRSPIPQVSMTTSEHTDSCPITAKTPEVWVDQKALFAMTLDATPGCENRAKEVRAEIRRILPPDASPFEPG